MNARHSFAHMGPLAPPLLTDQDFAMLATIARDRAGLTLDPLRISMLQARLSRRLRALNLIDIPSYLKLLNGHNGGQEIPHMVASLTTPVSYFFREPHHFDLLRHVILPGLERRAQQGHPIRLWSAGTAYGQEAYSIAMTLADTIPDYAAYDIRILATDISADAIGYARRGHYTAQAAQDIPAPLRQRFLVPDGTGMRITPGLRNLVSFHCHNLHDDLPIDRQCDLIFCRNVAIYFTPVERETLWRRLERYLRADGWLFLGHSERIASDAGSALVSDGLTAYRVDRSKISNGSKSTARGGCSPCH